MEAQCGCVGGQVYRKDQERQEQVANGRHHGRKRKTDEFLLLDMRLKQHIMETLF